MYLKLDNRDTFQLLPVKMSTHREEHNTKKQSQLINEINYSKIVFTVPTQITIFTSQITIFTYQKSKDAEHYKLNTGAKRSAKGPKLCDLP